MQFPPQDGVAAAAESAPRVLTPPTRASAAAPASSLLLMDISVPFIGNHSRTLRTAVVTGHPPGQQTGRHCPIRAGTADLIVVLVKGEDHRANRARKLSARRTLGP